MARSNDEIAVHYCDKCDFCCHSHRNLIKHAKNYHASDPNFSIYCTLCGKHYKKWSSFTKHLKRNHYTLVDALEEDSETTGVEQLEPQTEEDMEEQSNSEELSNTSVIVDSHWRSAQFLLGMTQQLGLTHSSVEELSERMQWYVEEVCSEITRRVEATCSTSTQDELIQCSACTPGDLFEGLKTRHSREEYYKNHFNYVEPTPVLLGSDWEWTVSKGSRKLKEVKQFGYSLDLIEGLKALLNNPDVRREIRNPHESTDDCMRDLCDGKFVRNHPLFTKYRDALQFLIYYDDIEVANPLGAKAGMHKLGVFYYVLGNVRPLYRSSMRSIQLLAIAKTRDLRQNGCDAILQPFIDQVNDLGTDAGCQLQIGDQTVTLRGAVVAMSGDIPGSNFIGGFKEGVGFSLRKCRMCLTTADDMETKFHASDFIMRDLHQHKHHLALIDESNSHSTTYGVNNASPLLKLANFDITNCLPFDAMHTIFEGVVNHHLNLLLRHLIDFARYFSLADLNNIISTHLYGYSEIDKKPTPISKDSATHSFKIKLSASQMMTLMRLLPYMIGNLVDEEDEHWECFLTLWDIADIATAFEVTDDDAAHLAWLVEIYLEEFSRLYGRKIKPKMHYLIHLPHTILMFGPLRQYWCMRFESKNAQIKRFIRGNYQNVALSAAIRHQQWMCYKLLVTPGQHTTNFLYQGDTIISGKEFTGDEVITAISTICREEITPSHLLKAKGVAIHGIEYRIDAIVRVKSVNENGFYYGKITDVFVYRDHKVFCIMTVDVVAIIDHIRAIEVEAKEEVTKLISYNDLFCHGVLHLLKRGLKTYVIERDYRSKHLIL